MGLNQCCAEISGFSWSFKQLYKMGILITEFPHTIVSGPCISKLTPNMTFGSCKFDVHGHKVGNSINSEVMQSCRQVTEQACWYRENYPKLSVRLVIHPTDLCRPTCLRCLASPLPQISLTSQYYSLSNFFKPNV